MMTINVSTLSLPLRDEVTALIETGLYENEELVLADAVRTFLAARPDLREAVACKLYERGRISLGRAAEWSNLSIEAMKKALYRRGVTRVAPENVAETEAMARKALETAGRTVS
jgi:predicted HTH domain antitoxin